MQDERNAVSALSMLGDDGERGRHARDEEWFRSLSREEVEQRAEDAGARQQARVLAHALIEREATDDQAWIKLAKRMLRDRAQDVGGLDDGYVEEFADKLGFLSAERH